MLSIFIINKKILNITFIILPSLIIINGDSYRLSIVASLKVVYGFCS